MGGPSEFRCVELFSVSKTSGVDRDRNGVIDGGSSFSVRIFELNFAPPTCLLTAALILAVVVASGTGVAVSVLISSVSVGSPSISVVDSVVVVLDFCSEGNSSFKFGLSIFLCL